MNKTEYNAKTSAGGDRRQKDRVLREVMPQLGMEPTEPNEYYKTQTKRKRLLSTLIILCVVVAVVAVLSVYLLTPCKFASLEVAEQSYTAVTVAAQVKKTPLLDSVTAELNGKPLAADQQSDPGSFLIEAKENGTLTVTARSVTGRTSVQQIDVSGIDTEPPYLVSDEKTGNNIYIHLEDDDSGINWDTVEVTGIASGDTYKRAAVNADEGTVRVSLPRNALRIWVEDMAGNHMSLRLEPVTADDEDTAGETAADAGQDEAPAGGLASSPFAGAADEDDETPAP